ncbi:hypothetical protein COV20_06165 [Candidatus Woesearchaeota archaeon CG10_big_fil_rev_8_21_14_0_10_45_16]|nr:MAG: hypothetical protein COV20_06165 [Candidatus Woesearchaeota archaeon CG10_big_fil_rev_8_21_14_0_10_45_16]
MQSFSHNIMVSTELLALFPHEKIREGQKELVADIEEVFDKGQVLLAHAPTGLGKTASALAAAIKEAQAKNKRVFFLTNRHTQHQIAVNTLKLIGQKTGTKIPCVDLIGKRWMCSQEVSGLRSGDFMEYCKTIVEKGECEFFNNVKTKSSLTAEAKYLISEIKKRGALHNEELMEMSKEKKMCSYEVSLALAKDAPVIIGDYYYLFNPHVQSTLFAKLELQLEDVILIVDEAHNLPGRIADMLTSSLTTVMLRNAVSEAQKFGYKGLVSWLQDINSVLLDLAVFTDNDKEKLVTKEVFVNAIKKRTDYDELINELEIAADEVRKKQRRSFLGGISAFLDAWLGEDEGYARIIMERQGSTGPMIVLRHSCLDPSIVSKQVFEKVHAAVLMSGTLKPTFMYKDLLGISKGIEKEYASPFPAENKLSLIVPETSTKFTVRGDAMYKRIAQICSEIAAKVPGNVALFFPSYYFRDNVSAHITVAKDLLWEKSGMTKEEKEEFLQQFKAKKDKGAVLLGVTGANFAEGVDFPGDLLNGVVIIGLPLAKPDLQTKQMIAYYDHKFSKGWDYGYTYPAINKCLQSAGRCIRSEKDRGAVIYLDERFAWRNYFTCFPREGLIVSSEYGKYLDAFFD